MKKWMIFLVSLSCIWGSSGSAFADDFREWTDADSKRTIHARLIDRKTDKDGRVQLCLLLKESSKTVWLPLTRLSSPDAAYAEQWVRVEDRLTVEADKGTMRAASGNRWDKDRPKGTIVVTVTKSTEPMTIQIYSAIGQKLKTIEVAAITEDDKPGEKVVTRAVVPATYSVELLRKDGAKLLTRTIEDL